MRGIRLLLPHSTVWTYPDQGLVVTRFGARECLATREDTDENRREALDQGYTGEDIVWRSLIDHELGHNLVSLWLWDSASPTLEHEAGVRRVEYGQRLYEEAVVIAFQRWMNDGVVWPALEQYRDQLPAWQRRYHSTLSQAKEAA